MDYQKEMSILRRQQRIPAVFIVVAICEGGGQKLLRVYPRTAKGYRHARAYMDNCRHNTQRRWHNLREDNNIVDVGLFEGDSHYISDYPAWVLIDHDDLPEPSDEKHAG